MVRLRLKKIREANQYTQEDIARYLHIARSTYARYETGEREMTYDSLIALADLYTVTIDYLLGRNEGVTLTLTNSEARMIHQFRQLDGRGQRLALAAVAYEFSQRSETHS